MKKTLILTTTILSLSMPAMAQDYGEQSPAGTQTKTQQEQPLQDPVIEKIAYLQKEWARIKYQVTDKDSQLNALKKLEKDAAKVTAAYSNRAEPKIWEAIILSTRAGIGGGLGALSIVKKAKTLLEAALKQNPNALDGSAHTSLGSLYYQVPGWPIGFGDDDKAEKHLRQALKTNPNGIDPNFFYADFLMEEGREDEAKIYLNRALHAANRPSRPLADAGRRQEIKAALAKINAMGKNKGKYN